MPNTITTYTTFVAATDAKASEVNANFSNYRGSILPIYETTAGASHLEHDLGQPDHIWNKGYINEVFVGETNTGWSVTTTDTAGTSFAFKKNGVESTRIVVVNELAVTTTAGLNQYAISLLSRDAGHSGSSVVSVKNSASGATLAASIQTNGRPVKAGFIATFQGSYIQVGKAYSTAASSAYSTFALLRNGSTVSSIELGRIFESNIPAATNCSMFYSPSSIEFTDISAPAGLNIYTVNYKNNSNGYAKVTDCYLTAYEL